MDIDKEKLLDIIEKQQIIIKHLFLAIEKDKNKLEAMGQIAEEIQETFQKNEDLGPNRKK